MADTPEAAARSTFACPICGLDRPHWHPDEQVAAYREDQMHASDGWTSAAHKKPDKRGWYLCLGVEINPDQFGKPKHFGDFAPRWAQLSWFLWVRQGGARGYQEKEIPEVLYFDAADGGWMLRNLLGDAVRSGAESRHRVYAKPKYWRELPAIRALAGSTKEGE